MVKQIGIYILSLLFAVFINGNSFDTLMKMVCKFHIAFNSEISFDEDKTGDEDRSVEDDDNDYLLDKLLNPYRLPDVLSGNSVKQAWDTMFCISEYYRIIYFPPDHI